MTNPGRIVRMLYSALKETNKRGMGMDIRTRRKRAVPGAVPLAMVAAALAIGLSGCSGSGEAAAPESSPTSDSVPTTIAAPEEESTPEHTAAQQEAIDKAVELSDQNRLSEAKLREVMASSGFSSEDIDYAVENAGISFTANAKKAADEYVMFSTPRDEIVRYLVDVCLFTQEQAEEAAAEYPA